MCEHHFPERGSIHDTEQEGVPSRRHGDVPWFDPAEGCGEPSFVVVHFRLRHSTESRTA